MKTPKYFNEKLPSGFVALYSGRMIQFVALGLIGLFLPIYLLTKFDLNITYVFLYYLVGHLLYALILPLGARGINKIGFRRALRWSVLFDSLFYVFVFLIDTNRILYTALSLASLIMARILFWLPYHTEFAVMTNNRERGKELGLMYATKSVLDIIMPVAAGILITFFGFKFVFPISIIIMLTSVIPFMALESTHEKFSWKYLETWKHYFSKNNRKIVLANMANGAENVVGIVIWPIFIWQILKGSYFAVGSISSLIVLISVILQLTTGKVCDSMDKRKILHWGTFLYALGWVAKIFVLTAFQIFIVGTYHSLVLIFKDTPFDVINYELNADHGHYVDEYTVLKELAIQLGKVIMLIFTILVASNLGLNWTFALAAIASLFINLL